MLFRIWLGRFSRCFRWVTWFSGLEACPPPPLCVGCFGLGFSRNCLGFVLESDREGGFSGFLSMDGVVFTGGCMTPPPFLFMSVVCLWRSVRGVVVCDRGFW